MRNSKPDSEKKEPLDPEQTEASQNESDFDIPGTGAVNPSVPPSPGEGISEKDIERSEKEVDQ
jgi:hypothetical protein